MYNLEKSRSLLPSSVLAWGCSSTQPGATAERCCFKYNFLITVTENHKSQNLGYVQDLSKFKPAASRNSHLASKCASHRSLQQFLGVSPAPRHIRNPGASHTTVSIQKRRQLWQISIQSSPETVTSPLWKWIMEYDNRSCLLSYWIPIVLLYTTLTWIG